MIRLTSKPTDEAIERLAYCAECAEAAINAGQAVPESIKGCYRHPIVKAAIKCETSGKCAYCEAKIAHVYWGDVEHIYPKSVFPKRALDYDNLTFSCAICNNNKGDYFNDLAPILNPYEDNPGEHLVCLGPFLWNLNGSQAGRRAIDLLDLNRPGLLEKRIECFQRLAALADRYSTEPDGLIKDTISTQIRVEVSESAEFAFAARAFLSAVYSIQYDEI